MKAYLEKILPWFLILIGGIRLLWERFPGRFAFLQIRWEVQFGWLFWLAGITGIVWLLLRSLGTRKVNTEKTASDEETPLRRFFQKYGIELLILFLTAASLSMLFRSGYYWDDAVNSTVYLAEKKDSVSTFRHVLDFMKQYLLLGRINVLSVYYYFFFYIENVSIYKGLIILTILIDQLIFRKMLLEYGVPLSGARLGMLLIPLLLQTRAYQDPVSGFYSLMQVLTAEMLLLSIFLRRWLNSGKTRYLTLSLLLFGIGLMTYEVCFPFLLMICVLIWIHRGSFGKAVRGSLPFVILTVLMILAVVIVRARYVTQGTYAGVAFNLDIPRILRAGLTQFCAGLPLSYYSAGYQAAVLGDAYPASAFMNYDFLSFLKSIRITDVLILAGCFLVLGKIDKPEKHKPSVELAVSGLCFAILPMITVAMSQRYQGQLMPGLGYLPVYMQYYGVAMLLLWLTLHMKPTEGKRAMCLSAFALILLLNLQNNRAVTQILNRSFYEPRSAGEAALHGGILDFLTDDAMLVSLNKRTYLWEANWNNIGLYREFYGNNSRHLPSNVGDNRILRDMVDEYLAAGNTPDNDGWLQLEPEKLWIIVYDGNTERGITRLGRVRSVLVDPESLELREAETDQVLYFISGSYPEKADVQYTSSDGTFYRKGPEDQLRVRQSANGILCQLQDDEVIIFHSLTVP